MRSALILILLFMTYSLFYLSQLPAKKQIAADKVSVKTQLDTIIKIPADKTKKSVSPGKIKVYNLRDLHTAFIINFRFIHTKVALFIRRYQLPLILGLIVFSTLSIGTSILSYKINLAVVAMLINNLSFSLSRLLIVILSVLSIGTWLFLRHNLWQDIGLPVFIIPFGILIASCISLRIRDFNYPIWNRLINSFIVPLIAGIIIIIRI